MRSPSHVYGLTEAEWEDVETPKEKAGLTATRLLRHSWQAPTFRITAAFCRCSGVSGPVRLLLARLGPGTFALPLTENTPWEIFVGEN